MMLGLVVIEGTKKGTYLRFEENESFWIGRSKQTHFILREEVKVSARHGCLIRKGDFLEFQDHSRNGTLINGKWFHQQKIILKEADLLKIGQTTFQVVSLEPSKKTENDFSRYQAKKLASIPSRLGAYIPETFLGSGAFSQVYKAVHASQQKTVALKIFSPNPLFPPNFMGRFLREAELLKKLSHPSIIQIYETGQIFAEQELWSYIALEYFPGISLREYVKMHGKISWEQVLPLFFQMAQALEAMHQQKILHRDLKPDNILYEETTHCVKIVDLGLGKCLSEKERETFCITAPESSLGTPHFMPLEQWQDSKQVTERADIYSLGATLYYLLSGTRPYENFSGMLELYYAIIQQKLVPLAEMVPAETPRELIEIIEIMMAVDEEDRYFSASAVLEALKQLQ